MPWFLVDDQFHSSSTLRKILATEPAAVGLWTVAGSWSSANLTDGFVPDDVLPWLFPDAPRLAEALVTARAWRRVKGGHKFVPGVTHKIPSRTAVENDRKAAAERQRRRRGGELSRRDSGVTNGVSHSAQSSPSPDVYRSVVDHVAVGNGRASPEMIDLIMEEIEMATGRRISAEYAQRTYVNIIGSRQPDNPAAYLRKAIRNEPDPRKRFLPLYPEGPP